MKELFKSILKSIQLYHPLQSWYRRRIFNNKLQQTRRQYAPLKGSGFTCNVCQASYRQFVPDHPEAANSGAIYKNEMIAGYGTNILCPHCGSTARERLVIARLAAINLAGKNILHLSPEKNVYDFLRNQANVTTADLLPGFYKTVDGRVKKEDATRLSYETGSFHLVIANHILEHIPNDIKAMSEIYRVLVPGGTAILQVPYSEKLTTTQEQPGINDPAQQSALFGQKDHVRNYALVDYVDRLRSCGFEVTVCSYNELAQYYKYAIQQGESFIEIKKPANA